MPADDAVGIGPDMAGQMPACSLVELGLVEPLSSSVAPRSGRVQGLFQHGKITRREVSSLLGRCAAGLWSP